VDRPWAGYGIQTGSWLTGDFNGDGRDDFAHLTAGDYANIWLAQANGHFAVSPHRPWPAYNIQNGSWQTGDFNGDGSTDLLHLTTFGYANLWTAVPGGFSVSWFQPWPGYRM